MLDSLYKIKRTLKIPVFDILQLGVGPVNLTAIYVDKTCMTKFDQEMAIFKEIIPRYKPVPGFHLVLDLAAYRAGKESIQKYKIGCEKYRHYINVECHDNNIETVIITSNKKNQIAYRSEYLYSVYSCDLSKFVEIEDLTPPRRHFKKTMQQELDSLCYDLNNPQPVKPDC